MPSSEVMMSTNADRMIAPHKASMPIRLQASGLKKAFGGHIVLDGINLKLHQGEVVLLRGENGSGKTTLLNILTGNLEPDAGIVQYIADGTPRTYRFPRRWWKELNPFDHFSPEFVARESVGRTWQEVRLFGSQTLRNNIAVAEPNNPGENPIIALFTPRRAAVREAEINAEADKILARLGLSGCEEESADKISLGQTKRVAIARAIAAGAMVLFLDEPLRGLDRQGVIDTVALLKTLAHDYDVSLVIVEHVCNQGHLENLVSTDWLLAGGKLVSSKLQAARRAPMVSSAPVWFRLLAGAGAKILHRPLPRGAVLTTICHHEHSLNNAVLEIKRLIVKRGPRNVIGLDDRGAALGFDLTLHEGEIAILQAPNGWGKSTLMDAIAGTIPVASGTITIANNDATGLAPWDRHRAGLTMVPATQNVMASLTVRELLRLAKSDRSPRFLKRLQTEDLPMSVLSGGQRRLLALATARSADHSRVRLFDEPFSMLDSAAVCEAVEFLRPDRQSGVLICVPTSSDL
jgi:ABC-type branched-subunit amino acid transport system ATPase component